MTYGPDNAENGFSEYRSVNVRFGLRVRQLRSERQISAHGFAALVGVPDQLLLEIEEGRAEASLDLIRAIADALGISMSGLVKSL